MATSLKDVNHWAEMSCPKWNKNKATRRLYRVLYRNAAKKFWESPEHQRLIQKYKSGKLPNTYPWPYKDPDFANWEEDDSDENYSLISDQSGCVIRYATSYVAWKIFEATGAWPQKTSPIRLDAKNWLQFLAEAGYKEVVDRPELYGYYVGIDPSVGEWGLVVWYECDSPQNKVTVSTYRNKEYILFRDDPGKYAWVKITERRP